MRCAVPMVVIVVISLLVGPISSAQNPDSDVQSALVSGPTYITLVCDQGSCSGYTLEVISEFNSTFEDSFSWSGNAEGVLDYRVVRAPGASGIAHARVLTSDPDYIHETGDIGSSLTTASLNNSLPITDGCTDSICDMSKLTTKRMSGWLNTGGDSDYWLISANSSTYIEEFRSEAPAIIEFWKIASNGSRLMIERLTSTLQDGIHEISSLTVVAGSDEEIWMVVSSVELDRRDSVYMASVFVSHNEKDAPSTHKQSSGRIYQPKSNFKFVGISHKQSDVDSILIPAGGRFTYEIQILNSENNDSFISIHEHLLNGDVSEDLGQNNGITSSRAISLEIRFHMMVPMTYSGEIELTSNSTDFSGLLSGRDSVYLGDAPDILPTYNADIDYWPIIAVDLNESGPDVSTYRLQGDVFGMDMIDTYLISISSESGSLIRAVAESGSASIQIQQLTQSGTYHIKNSSNGSQLFLPMGVHAIRIEGSPQDGGAYSFLISASQSQPIDSGVFVDLSSKATPYYIFAGLFLLAPSVLVAFFMRREIINRIFGRGPVDPFDRDAIESIVDELRRRESEGDVEGALKSFHGHGLTTSRASFLIEKGLPDMDTTNVTVSNPMGDIGIWLDDAKEGILTFGIHAKVDWKLACLRLSYPGGTRSKIVEISLESIFSDDEVMLGDLKDGQTIMSQLKLDPIPEIVEIEVTGRVKGESVAIVPRDALAWR